MSRPLVPARIYPKSRGGHSRRRRLAPCYLQCLMSSPRLLVASWMLLAAAASGCAAEVPEEPPQGSWVEVIREPVFHPWARFPEQDPGYRSVEVQPDHLIFTFDGAS